MLFHYNTNTIELVNIIKKTLKTMKATEFVEKMTKINNKLKQQGVKKKKRLTSFYKLRF
jgi:hypothetical protein